MDSINHRLYRLLLSANLVEHVFEGLGSVIGVSSRLSQKQEQPSTLVTYVTLVKGWFQKCVSWFQKHTFETDTFINVEIFNNLLLHDLFYTFIVFLPDIPSFTIFSVIKWILFILLFNFIMPTIGVKCNIQWIPKLLMAWKNIIHVYIISIYLFFVSKLSQVDIDMKT